MPYLPPAPVREKPLVAGDAYAPTNLGVHVSSDTGSNGTPDTVSGHRYTYARQVLYTLGTIAQVPLLPLWPFFLAKEAKDWSIARNYFGTLKYCLKAIYDHIAYGSFVRMFKYNILHGPDYMRHRIAQRRGSCTRCAKCCRGLNCIFLGQDRQTGDYYCKVFGTAYWYYGTCGRYPIDQRDIDDHACPGFSFPRTPEERAARLKLPAPQPRKLPVV